MAETEKSENATWDIEVTFRTTAEGRTAMRAWETVRWRFPEGFPEIQLTDMRVSKTRTKDALPEGATDA